VTDVALRTHWLYRGEEVLTAVRALPGTDHSAIIAEALRQHDLCNLPHGGYTPHEWRRMLADATIR